MSGRDATKTRKISLKSSAKGEFPLKMFKYGKVLSMSNSIILMLFSLSNFSFYVFERFFLLNFSSFFFLFISVIISKLFFTSML